MIHQSGICFFSEYPNISSTYDTTKTGFKGLTLIMNLKRMLATKIGRKKKLHLVGILK